MSIQRLGMELKNSQENPIPGVHLAPSSENLREWTATINGPVDTPYEGGAFQLRIDIPEGYPFKPPKVCFLTRIFHPNIYTNGKICLDILTAEKWTPLFTLVSILQSLQSLLNDPNPDSPANCDAGKLYRNDRFAYNEKVRSDVLKYAIPNPDGGNCN
jgi:ubiquitin-protein ligase